MTTEEKTSRSVENPYATTNKKPSPSAFVIWLIATIVLLGGAIGLGIATYHWGSSGIEVENYRKELSEEIKKEIEQPCEEFESFINACKSGELDNDRDLAPYWDSYVNAMGSRDIDHFRQSNWSMESSSNYVDWYDVQDIAKNVGFMKDEYNSFGSLVDTNVIDAKYADEFEKVLLERINEIMRTELRELESDNYYNEVAIRFLISCIVCLILGVIGVFVTLSRRKKLKQGRVAYENAVLAYAISEEKQKSEMLLIMEAMQRKIDALEEKATTEPTPQNTTQMPEQQIETPIGATSAQQLATTATSSTNASVYMDSDTTTDTQTEFNQDAPVDSQSENQEGASPRGEAARPDQITIGKAPKNPIKYLKFLVKTPIKTMADIEQMKKISDPCFIHPLEFWRLR